MITNWIQKIIKGVARINTMAATLSGVILLFITLSIFVDVFLRYFFNQPSIWITEVSTYLFLYVIFLGTAHALQEGMHIRVTFLLDMVGEKTARFIDIFTSLLAMIFSLVLLWQTSIMTWTSFEEDWTSPSMLNAPYAYIYLAMVLGSALLVLTFLGNIFSLINNNKLQN